MRKSGTYRKTHKTHNCCRNSNVDNGRPANTAVYIIMWEEIAPSSIINKCKKKRGHLKLGNHAFRSNSEIINQLHRNKDRKCMCDIGRLRKREIYILLFLLLSDQF